MSAEKKINDKLVKIVKDDITAMDVDAFVFYAAPDLQLGTGYGNAISVRGGPKIQDELRQFGTVETGTAVTTSGGSLKAKFVIHAVGPRFQEADTEGKLETVTQNALKEADAKGVESLAFPPMGSGFYGIPLDVSAKVMLAAIRDHLAGQTKLKEVLICARDTREMKPFQTVLETLS
ncbi:MAG: macro domain-containing protein [Deltaproteobacteria bacterium]|nr:macro domain-containing protein [Deltaproteobacteria bacterium]